MNYKKTVLKNDLVVEDVISIHYFEYAVDFTFSGELHDFWEFVYADKNELIVTADAREILLPQGCLYLHKPMEFHNVRGNGVNAPNSVIVSFSSQSPSLFEAAGKILPCRESEMALMAGIIEEGKRAFSSPLGDPYTEELVRVEDPVYGAEQLIRLRLEELLISLVRSARERGEAAPVIQPGPRRRKDEVRLREICDFLARHVEEDVKSEDVQREFFISESSLQKLFQHKVGCGAMQYFQRMKVDRAKELIREKKMNFSEIAEKLGFSSIHYFSRRFKSITGMTPSEYALSVTSISAPPEEAPEERD